MRRTGRIIRRVAIWGGISAALLIVLGIVLAAIGSNDPRDTTATTAGTTHHSLPGAAASIPGVTPSPVPTPALPAGPIRVHFYVTGNAPGGATIQYGSDSDTVNVPGTMGSLGDAVPVPYKARMAFDGSAAYYSLQAQLEDGGGQIQCKLVVTKPGYDPLVVAHGSASGQYAICDVQAAPNNSQGTSWYRE
jgi:hypothetical protein